MTEEYRDTLSYARKQTINIPPPESEVMMAIRRTDWERMRRQLQRAAEPPPLFHTIGSLAVGFVVSAVFSMASMSTATNLANWVMPAHVAAIIFGLLLGGVCFLFDHLMRKQYRSAVRDVEDDMSALDIFEAAAKRAQGQER